MSTLANPLLFVAAAALGLFAGSMLTEAGVLVPYWRSLPTQEFFAWYGANDALLFTYFSRVTALAGLSSIAAAGVALWTGHPGRWLSLLALALALICIAMFPVYFEAANASFAAASVPPDRLAGELARWATWHWVRTALSVAASWAALRAYAKS